MKINVDEIEKETKKKRLRFLEKKKKIIEAVNRLTANKIEIAANN